MTAESLEPVIGLEVHAQLATRSKMFCGCDARYFQAAPNSHVCEVCSGMPGALPVINAAAVDMTVKTALALNCSVTQRSKFDRKNYPYPDLPKGYQISQYDAPIGVDGDVRYLVDDTTLSCGIVRVHLEEDTGKSSHPGGSEECTLLDFNRSGVPLMEIVSKPDLRSAEQARAYFESLRRILMYLEVCDGNLEQGSMRADVNISLRPSGAAFGTPVEIKNLNSFRAVQRAVDFEIARQTAILSSGEAVVRETRGWSERDDATLSQRTKEQAHDYRYFPEPDLPELVLSDQFVAATRALLPELPLVKWERFQREHGLPVRTSAVLADDAKIGNFFEEVLVCDPALSAHLVATWVTGEVLRLLNETHVSIEQTALSAENLASLLASLRDGAINGTAAKLVLERIYTSGEVPGAVIEELDLGVIGDEATLRAMVKQVLADNEALVLTYLGGKENALQAIKGRVMKASGGKADMATVGAIVDELMEARR